MFDKRLMQLCPESKKFIIGNILLQWAELFLNAVMIFQITNFIENLISGEWNKNIYELILIVALAIVARFFTTKATISMSYFASKTVKQKMRTLIYEKLLRLGNGWKNNVSAAEIVQESVEGVEQLESYFGQYVPQFFYAFLAPFTLFAIFGLMGSWKTATVLLICVPLIPGAIMMVQKIAKKILSKYWGQYTKLGSTFLENLQGMTTLKTYQADEFKNEEMNRESENFRKVTMKVLIMQLNSIIIMDFFTYGGSAIGIIMALKSFFVGQTGISTTLFMILMSAEFFLPMRRLGSYFHIAMNGMAASDKIFKFLQSKENDKKTETLENENIFKIIFENVNFSYDDSRKILKNVNLEISKNDFIGIVGESGSGKSTIASIIMGKNQTLGATINKKNIQNINEKSLMKKITYVSHNTVFFKGSIKENLLIASPNATDEELFSALEKCRLLDFIKTQGGLNFELKENASNLSGGQKQRLSLARALLHNSEVYIFDEATSNIDVESEEIILEVLKELTKQKTVIMISHRLANVKSASKIYVMKNGELVQSGIHKELLDQNGEYKKLWETQQEMEQFAQEEDYDEK